MEKIKVRFTVEHLNLVKYELNDFLMDEYQLLKYREILIVDLELEKII